MSESDQSMPQGPAEFLRFEGILDGRRRDDEALKDAVRRLREATGLGFDIEAEGPRFSILPDDEPVPAQNFVEERRGELVSALQSILAAAEPGSCESTLRCTVWFRDQVAETLFGIRGDELKPVGRLRPRQSEEGPGAQKEEPGKPLVERRQLAWMIPALLLAFSLMAWQSGLFTRALAASAQDLELRTGGFDDRLELTIRSEFYKLYVVEVRQGPGYPKTNAEIEASVSEAVTPADRAIAQAIGDGSTIYVLMLDAEGKVLDRQPLSLRSFLTNAEAKEKIEFKGQLGAASIELSLDRRSED